jgi:hypothetical protein
VPIASSFSLPKHFLFSSTLQLAPVFSNYRRADDRAGAREGIRGAARSNSRIPFRNSCAARFTRTSVYAYRVIIARRVRATMTFPTRAAFPAASRKGHFLVPRESSLVQSAPTCSGPAETRFLESCLPPGGCQLCRAQWRIRLPRPYL